MRRLIEWWRRRFPRPKSLWEDPEVMGAFQDQARYRQMLRHVASNESLMTLIRTNFVRERFVDALLEHIQEQGLTFYQRDFVTMVTTRVNEEAWSKRERRALVGLPEEP